MATGTSRRGGAFGAVVLVLCLGAGSVSAAPVTLATPEVPLQPSPLADAVKMAAVKNSGSLGQTPSPVPHKKSCGTKATLGALIGAGVGVGSGVVLLARTGGSDESGRVLFNFAALGASFGVLAGLMTCVG